MPGFNSAPVPPPEPVETIPPAAPETITPPDVTQFVTNTGTNTGTAQASPSVTPDVTQSVTPEGAPAEPGQEGEPTETPAPDPYDRFKGSNGLYFGRYESPEAALEAMQNIDRQRGELMSRLGQVEARLGLATTDGAAANPAFDLPGAAPAAPAVDPIRDLAPLVNTPPSKLTESDAFVQFAVNELGMEWTQDDIDEDRINPADLVFAREQMMAHVHQAQETVQQEQQAVQQHEEAFYTRHPHLSQFQPQVDQVAGIVLEQVARGERVINGPEDFYDIVAAGVKEMLLPNAAALLGARGAAARAAQPQQPAPGLPAGGNGTPRPTPSGTPGNTGWFSKRK